MVCTQSHVILMVVGNSESELLLGSDYGVNAGDGHDGVLEEIRDHSEGAMLRMMMTSDKKKMMVVLGWRGG
jgi:hypothetical protein